MKLSSLHQIRYNFINFGSYSKKLKSEQHEKVFYTHHKQNTKIESTSYQQVHKIFFLFWVYFQHQTKARSQTTREEQQNTTEIMKPTETNILQTVESLRACNAKSI